MRFQDIMKLAPESVPIATVPFRGLALDLYAIRGEDVFWLIQMAPAIVSAWTDNDGDDLPEDATEAQREAASAARTKAVLKAIGEHGETVMNRLLCVALRTDEASLKKLDLIADEQIDILTAFISNGIPEDMLGKLVLGLRAGAVRAGLRMPGQHTGASAASSTGSSETGSTPTA